MALKEKTFRERLDALRPAGVRPGLDNIRALLAALGDPQDSLRCVHVAGTNGKGAVCTLIDSALQASGCRTARYTSPHLISLNERFMLNGRPVPDETLDGIADELFAAVAKVEAQGMSVTFFECLTAAAFLVFRNAAPDVVILESGLGGRRDATNVLKDVLVAVVTRIGLDHCEWLGSTHAAIAEEKAGILHPGRPVVCGPMPESARETVERFASLEGCAFTAADEHVAVESISPLVVTTPIRNPPPIALALEGAFQVENAVTALTTIDVLCKDWGFHVPDLAVKSGFERAVWPGRFQKVVHGGVTFIVDGAHNPDGAMALRDSLRMERLSGPIAFVCGFCSDKDVLANLRVLSALSTIGWAVPLANARSLDPASVAERMTMAGFVSAEPCSTLDEGLERAAAWARDTGGTPVVCGSLFLAGEALQSLGAYPWALRTPDANELFPRADVGESACAGVQ